jgi:hypothetical protein
MAFYTVMIPPPGSGGRIEEIERARLLPDSFAWWALLLSGLWLLANRLWLATLFFLLFWGGLVYAESRLGLNGNLMALAHLAIGLFLGLEGRNLVVRKLARQGWRLADVVEARDLAEAERRYFERALAGASAPARPASAPTPQRDSGPVPVIGLFPEAQGR